MGIDALDLTFRLEKQLDIKISRPEGIAVLFDTAGTIHRYLVSKLQGEYRQVPRIEPVFKEVADAVNRITGWWRLTSSLDLNRRFSPATRAANWQALEDALGMSLPKLEQPADDEFPKIPRQCDSVISLTYWIVEHHPERVEWFSGASGANRSWVATSSIASARPYLSKTGVLNRFITRRIPDAARRNASIPSR